MFHKSLGSALLVGSLILGCASIAGKQVSSDATVQRPLPVLEENDFVYYLDGRDPTDTWLRGYWIVRSAEDRLQIVVRSIRLQDGSFSRKEVVFRREASGLIRARVAQHRGTAFEDRNVDVEDALCYLHSIDGAPLVETHTVQVTAQHAFLGQAQLIRTALIPAFGILAGSFGEGADMGVRLYASGVVAEEDWAVFDEFVYIPENPQQPRISIPKANPVVQDLGGLSVRLDTHWQPFDNHGHREYWLRLQTQRDAYLGFLVLPGVYARLRELRPELEPAVVDALFIRDFLRWYGHPIIYDDFKADFYDNQVHFRFANYDPEGIVTSQRFSLFRDGENYYLLMLGGFRGILEANEAYFQRILASLGQD